MKKWINRLLEALYPPFKRMMLLQTFKYAACGGGNSVLGLLNYWLGYNYIFDKSIFDFGFMAFKPHMAALFYSSSITFFIGFILNKYIVFTGSYLRGRIQLFRYFLSFAINLVINYLMLKVLVEYFHGNPIISQVATILFVICISYLTQKHFTFRIHKKPGETDFTELH